MSAPNFIDTEHPYRVIFNYSSNCNSWSSSPDDLQTCHGVCFVICSYADANQKAIAQAFFLPPLRDTPPQVLAIDVRNCVWVFKYKRFLTKCVYDIAPKPSHNT